MQFHNYIDSYAWDDDGGHLKKAGIKNLDALVDYQLRLIQSQGDENAPYENVARYLLMASEQDWIKEKRPYYDIYSSMIPVLEGLKLDFPLKDVFLPLGMKRLLVRFPISHDINTIFFFLDKVEDEYRCMINMFFRLPDDPDDQKRSNVTTVWHDDATGQSALDYIMRSDINPDMDEVKIDLIRRVFTTFVGICLIGNDPEIIERQILSKDLHKLTDENQERLAEKAKKRGKFGFSFGAKLEKIPHLRRPHPCWVPYGPGRKYRKFKMRKGSIVHREKIERIPTGNLDDA